MKKVIKPQEHEEAVYFSDFTGKALKEQPPVEIKIDFNYESKYDGCHLNLHLSDKDFEQLWAFLNTKLTEEFKNTYEKFE